MSAELPPGFVLDPMPSTGSQQGQLPPGFVLDEPSVTKLPQESTFARDVARGSKNALTGLLSVADTPALAYELASNIPKALGNIGNPNAPSYLQMVGQGYQNNSFAPKLGQKFAQYADQSTFGETAPRDNTERLSDAILQGVGGAIPAVLSGGATLPTLATGALGAGVNEAAIQGGASPELAMGLSIGSGALAQFGGSALTRMNNANIGKQAAANQTLQDFQDIGLQPSAGQVTQGFIPRMVESGLSKSPLTAKTFSDFSQKQQADLGNFVENTASGLTGRVSATDAGKAIQRGITHDGGFLERVNAVEDNLYTNLGSKLSPGQQISVANTTTALDNLTAPIAGAENLSNNVLRNNPILTQLKESLALDAGPNGQIPYDALKQVRSDIGKRLSDFSLTDDLPRAQLKKIYAALSQDMKTAALAAGPEAYTAFKRANVYTKAKSNRIDSIDLVLDKNGGPEKVFASALAGTKDGATTLTRVMRSLPQDGKQAVTAAVLNKLGKATSGNQNEAGTVFSTQSFLTNWNNLSKEAKGALFDYNPDLRQNLDKVARVASNLREGNKVFANPSGTAGALNVAGALSGVVAGFHFAPVMTTLGLAGSYIGAKAFTSPRFVEWLAKTPDFSKIKSLPTYQKLLTQHLGNLAVIAQENPDFKPVYDDLKNEFDRSASN